MAEGDKKEEFEKKKVSAITVSWGMLWSVASMLIGSYFGVAGTMYGAALGSGMSAAGGVWYENFARKAHAKLKAKKEQEKVERNPERHPLQAKLAAGPLGREGVMQIRERRILHEQHHNPWKTAVLGLAMAIGCFGVAAGTLFTIESASGRTLHSDLTGARQYGTSFGGYSTVAPVTPSFTPSSPSSSSPSASSDASPDASPDLTPGGAPSVLPSSSSSSTVPAATPSAVTAPAGSAAPSSSMTTAP